MTIVQTARRAALVTATLALGVGLAGPASAAVEKHNDPAKDVTKFSQANPDGKRAKSIKSVDVTRFTTRHGKSKVTITTTLRKVTGEGALFYTFLRTPGADYVASGSFSGGEGEVVVFENGGPLRPFATSGVQPTCQGAKVKVSAKKDTFTTTIPRSCLGGPEWVRTGGIVGFENSSGFAIDDVRQKGYKNMTEEPALGKKVRRG